MAKGDKRDPADALPERARTLVNRHFGADAQFDSGRIKGHEVWRVRQRETGETFVVKSGANASTARAMADSGVAARVLAADDAAGICVMEDVGSTTLADILTAGDAQEASQGLLSLARTLGALHGWSSTREPTQSRLPPGPPLPLAAFMNICGALGVDADRARVELIEAEHCMHSEDPQVVVHGDPCPENFVPGPSAEDTGKFVDFEVAHRGNAILEAACWHMPFPTAWRVARMPLELLPHMDASYAAGWQPDHPSDWTPPSFLDSGLPLASIGWSGALPASGSSKPTMNASLGPASLRFENVGCFGSTTPQPRLPGRDISSVQATLPANSPSDCGSGGNR